MSSQTKYSEEVEKMIAEETKRREEEDERRKQMEIIIGNAAKVPAADIRKRLGGNKKVLTTFFNPSKRPHLTGFQHFCKKAKIQGGDGNPSIQNEAWAGLSDEQKGVYDREAKNDGIGKAKKNKSQEFTNAINSIQRIMKVLDDVYQGKVMILYGTYEIINDELQLICGLAYQGEELKDFVGEVQDDLKKKFQKAILPDGYLVQTAANPARDSDNARRKALRDRLHRILADRHLVNKNVNWTSMLREGEQGRGIVAVNWPENVPFGNPAVGMDITHVKLLEEALDSDNPPTFYSQAA